VATVTATVATRLIACFFVVWLHPLEYTAPGLCTGCIVLRLCARIVPSRCAQVGYDQDPRHLLGSPAFINWSNHIKISTTGNQEKDITSSTHISNLEEAQKYTHIIVKEVTNIILI
jgi:hypothetical protein